MTPLDSCKTENQLLERFCGIALEKQLVFGEKIGSLDWSADLEKEEISFGGQFSFPLQVIGTFSHSALTWIWAWDNQKSGFTPGILRDARAIKEIGQSLDIDLLKMGSFDFTKEELHLIGIVAAGLVGADAYYIADYGQGCLIATLHSPELAALHLNAQDKVFSVFPQAISLFELDQRNALRCYLEQKGYEVEESRSFVAGSRGKEVVTARFDAEGRMTELKGQ